MAEGQVSVEGRTHAMDELFFVVATQNPVEFRGTYPLPEAQMDRFAMCIALGYVEAEVEAEVLAAQDFATRSRAWRAAATREEVLALKERVRHVRLAGELRRYIVESCAARAAPRRCSSVAGRAPRRPRGRGQGAGAVRRRRVTCGPSTCTNSPCRCSRTAWSSIRRQVRRRHRRGPGRRHPARGAGAVVRRATPT
jgi:MoxR-like ATPase